MTKPPVMLTPDFAIAAVERVDGFKGTMNLDHTFDPGAPAIR